jgi:CSLREA domain-containing protein
MPITFSRSFKLLTIFLLALAFSVTLPRPTTVGAATLTVNTLVDEADGSCADSDCSLRDAITTANSNVGSDTIEFAVAGTINVATDLPALTDGATFIDGTTAPGYADTPVVIVDGSAISSSSTIGLIRFSSSNNGIVGLRLQNVFVAGVNIQQGDSNQILYSELVGNEYGVTIFGESDDNVVLGNLISENEYGGIFMDCDGSQIMQNNQIVGNQIVNNHTQGFTQGAGIDISPVAGTALVSGTNIGSNTISGNDGSAVLIHPRLDGASVTGTEINGNTIGGNGRGIELSTTGAPSGAVSDTNIVDNTITNSGGILAQGDQNGDLTGLTVAGNAVSDSDTYAIAIVAMDSADASDYEIIGNTFTHAASYGVQLSRFADAAQAAGIVADNQITDNGAAGVLVYRVQQVQIGPDNVITGNATATFDTGLAIVGDDALAVVTENSIYNNVDLGIDLEDDGVTPNDFGDVDSGPNGLLNFPVITSASMTTVLGTACSGCVVEVFAAVDDGDDNGHGEGMTFLGSAGATQSGHFSVAIQDAPDCGWVTATATEPSTATSEFSANVRLPCSEFTPTPSTPHRRPTRTPTPAPTSTPQPPTPTSFPPLVTTATPTGGTAPAVSPPATGEGPSTGGDAWTFVATLVGSVAAAAGVGVALRARRWRT